MAYFLYSILKGVDKCYVYDSNDYEAYMDNK